VGDRVCEHAAVREVALDRAPISSKLEPQDVRRTVEKMAESLLSAPGVREAVGGTRPVLDVEPLKNRTTQHVDMVSITDSLRMQLLRSGCSALSTSRRPARISSS
jgi:PBP1b-binding outer membrane lipoprotein LpoB